MNLSGKVTKLKDKLIACKQKKQHIKSKFKDLNEKLKAKKQLKLEKENQIISFDPSEELSISQLCTESFNKIKKSRNNNTQQDITRRDLTRTDNARFERERNDSKH